MIVFHLIASPDDEFDDVLDDTAVRTLIETEKKTLQQQDDRGRGLVRTRESVKAGDAGERCDELDDCMG